MSSSLIAYVLNSAMRMRLEPAPASRAWMEATSNRFAHRCLPLLIANQSGWHLLSEHKLRVTWDGNTAKESLQIEYLEGERPYPGSSHFGHGILTFNLPYLFRTPPGYNLLVRGPANYPKDGISALEGVVETDWCPATFTVNWKLTRPQCPVVFERGEPIAMLVPQRRGELESFHPAVREAASDPQTLESYRAWSRSRSQFLADLQRPDSAAVREKWQKHYFVGSTGEGSRVEDHQTKLHLRPFEEPTRTSEVAAPAPPREPRREEILAGLVVHEGFLDHATCDRLVGIHRHFGRLTTTSDNGVPLVGLRGSDPEAFGIVKTVLARIQALIRDHFRRDVACDHTLVCALTAGGHRHTLHADNARVDCPQHGSNAEELVRVQCSCMNIRVVPNHTPWRTHSALLYISDEHTGGHIVFGEGPNKYGGVYRKEINPTRGLLVLTPSNEHYFHHTTPVTSGVRYSMNSWFTDDPAHTTADWLAGSPR
jgi:hypothetical protein